MASPEQEPAPDAPTPASEQLADGSEDETDAAEDALHGAGSNSAERHRAGRRTSRSVPASRLKTPPWLKPAQVVEEAFRRFSDPLNSSWMRVLVPPVPRPESYDSEESPEWEWANDLVRGPWDRFVAILKSEKHAGPRTLRDLLAMVEGEQRSIAALKDGIKIQISDSAEALNQSLSGEDASDELHYDDYQHRAYLQRELGSLSIQSESVAFVGSVIRNVIWRYTAHGHKHKWDEISEDERSQLLYVPRPRPTPAVIQLIMSLLQIYDASQKKRKPLTSLEQLIRTYLDINDSNNREDSQVESGVGAVSKKLARAAETTGHEWPTTKGKAALTRKIDILREIVR